MGKSEQVLWLGLVLIAAQLFLSGQFKAIWSAITQPSTTSGFTTENAPAAQRTTGGGGNTVIPPPGYTGLAPPPLPGGNSNNVPAPIVAPPVGIQA